MVHEKFWSAPKETQTTKKQRTKLKGGISEPRISWNVAVNNNNNNTHICISASWSNFSVSVSH